MRRKEDAHTTLLPLIQLVGMPPGLHYDHAPELITGQFGKTVQKYWVRCTTTEPHSSW